MTNSKQSNHSLAVLEITAPLKIDKKPIATQHLFEALSKLASVKLPFKDRLLNRQPAPKSYSLEIVANNQTGIRFLWVIPKSQQTAIRRLLESYCPDFKITQTEDYAWAISNQVSLLNFKIKATKKDKLINQLEDLSDYDPLSYLTASFVKLKDGEQICYQILLNPQSNQSNPLQLILNFSLKLLSSVSNWLLNLFDSSNTKPKDSSTQQELAKDVIFKANLRVLISSPSSERLKEVSRILNSTLSLFNQHNPQNLSSKFLSSPKLIEQFKNRQFLNWHQTLSLDSTQLANLYHLPHPKASSLENMPYYLSKSLPALIDGSKTDKPHIILGDNLHQDHKTPLKLSNLDRQKHTYVLGATGMGKTSLLKYAIIQDINNDQGVAIIDPHGDLAQDILKHIPKSRINDVIYFNPIDYEYPLGMNLLAIDEDLEGEELAYAQDLRTESLVSIFKKIFSSESSDSGHRIEYVLRNTIQTSFGVVNPDLFTIFRLLNDRPYNSKVVAKLNNPYLKMFWHQEINRAGSFQRVKMQAGVTAKIGRFIFSPTVEKVFSQTDNYLDFKDLINTRKILICNFAKGLLGEDASKLFCATTLAKIQLAVLERARLNIDKRSDFYLYIDEFQNFASKNFIEILSEARKYGLYLTLAQQSIQQLNSKELAQIILANVANLIVFRTGSPLDADLILPSFEPFLNKIDFINQRPYNFYAKLSYKNNGLPTSAITRILEDPVDALKIKNRVIRKSQKNFASND